MRINYHRCPSDSTVGGATYGGHLWSFAPTIPIEAPLMVGICGPLGGYKSKRARPVIGHWGSKRDRVRT